jgi:hypothetical protein
MVKLYYTPNTHQKCRFLPKIISEILNTKNKQEKTAHICCALFFLRLTI